MLSKPALVARRLELVLNLTPSERELERFFSSHPHLRKLQKRIGFYVVDFVFPRKMVVLELDGPSHLAQKAYDKRRDAYLESYGFVVLRFPNAAVWSEPSTILRAVETYPNSPRRVYLSAMARLNAHYERTLKNRAKT